MATCVRIHRARNFLEIKWMKAVEDVFFHEKAGSMRKVNRWAWCCFGLFQVLVFLVAAAKPANAYVDPGSGLLFLQVGGSMLAGAMFVLRAKIRKLFGLANPAEAKDETKAAPVVEASAEPHA
jgi:hypothetical protein